uniref:NADH-ubiquinone oxidoreductase chain 4 n=1 Tax=Hildenbrandia rubra TaxID=31481 RepID=A0A0A7A7T4_9FLOR|nr:NADH dehydrogenase subunit 4 [Hildenbrandia rubra]AHB62139.1 NADH dehydrogenase subunit 4 [Hildenbrandia rubra]
MDVLLMYCLILLLSITPLLGVIILLFLPPSYLKSCFFITFTTSCVSFLVSLVLWIEFDSNLITFQFKVLFKWFDSLNFYYCAGIDGISLFFVILTTFLISICILVGWNTSLSNVKEYMICFLLLEFFLIQVFCVLDILLFYIFFESVLIPMFLIIGVWGSRARKIKASYQFFLYTLFGSLFMLLGILTIYFEVGTTDVQILWNHSFSLQRQFFLWAAFFLSFSIKIPMIPFHIWLPEAHSEAPTAGSIILAGILLKLGGYGFIRFSIPMFPDASIYFTPLVYSLSLIAVLYASLTTLRQVDLKKIVAYSSVSHMGFVTIGLFSFNIQGIEGSIFLMLSHGLVSSALFLLIGILYERYKTRIIKYYSGLVQVMPLFSIFFLFFTFANIAFPGTSSFVGELLVLISSLQFSAVLTFFISFNVVLSASYSIWLFNRVNFGVLKTFYVTQFQDLSKREFSILFIFSFLVCWLGVYPSIILDSLYLPTTVLLEQIN